MKSSKTAGLGWMTKASIALGCVLALPAHAQAPFPSKPITLIVSYPTGGVADLAARTVAQQLTTALGQTVVVENRPGGNQIIATSAALRAPADGYTLLVADDGIVTLNPHLFKKLPYKAADLRPVVDLAESRIVLSASKGLPADTLRGMVDYARAHPGKLNYGTLGIGNTHHLLLESIKQQARVDIVNVPYQGYAAAINDLVANQVQLVSGGVGSPALGHIKTGAIKALAVTGATRIPLLPDTPTFAEAGFAELQPRVSFIVFAPSSVPDWIVDTLNEAFAKALAHPQAASVFTQNGLDPQGRKADAVKADLSATSRKNEALVRTVGLTLD
ncbi:tripartite tricarboxylate transporter substrate binding protein [Pigmentiphaga sp. H8]|uniref:Bug family tripartite tricarboxylate transporter substrate binding protein n=1 Tax=Pigmentiphaga sp. H8 TaxID=2488560 RepID=UPI00137644CC|nr:tripartite tricarboxylate transporter substrate binding protein [Pigmentiphaga sp. H8]